ncbi:MAG: hypothetical protein JXB49_36635, partial [Bacteroidales bacterium]|nr:hypothetical protein [Bacteroidales bacterium]
VAPIDTICMHGSPLSRYDNRKMWEKYDYRNYGIIGEPYFDVDFSKVLYLTDTGRRWDGEKVSIRDKVIQTLDQRSKNKDQKEVGRSSIPLRRGQGEDVKKLSFHSTFDIIHAANAGSLPPQLMINVHPQRWDNRMLPWIKELFWQRVKNGVKGVIAR